MKNNFVCPKCGEKIFKMTTEPRAEEIPGDLVCSKCGRRFTEDDIRKQAGDIADKLIGDALKKAGL